MTTYEEKLSNLFSQLVNTFQEYERAFGTRAFSDLYENRLDESKLQIGLNKLALKICDLIDEINETFDAKEQLKHVEKFSEDIQEIINRSMSLKGECHTAKSKGTISNKELQSYSSVLDNLHFLDKTIKKYNSNFENKMLTLEQARKLFNEDLDKWFDAIIKGEGYESL